MEGQARHAGPRIERKLKLHRQRAGRGSIEVGLRRRDLPSGGVGQHLAQRQPKRRRRRRLLAPRAPVKLGPAIVVGHNTGGPVAIEQSPRWSRPVPPTHGRLSAVTRARIINDRRNLVVKKLRWDCQVWVFEKISIVIQTHIATFLQNNCLRSASV